MIALDTSALAAVALEEEEGELFSRLIAAEDTVIGTPSLVELASALTRLGPARVDAFIARTIREGEVRPVEFTFAMFETARDAFRRYGKGQGHPAQLNFGDCLSYAVARVLGRPLLYKGRDFIHTDIVPVWRP